MSHETEHSGCLGCGAALGGFVAVLGIVCGGFGLKDGALFAAFCVLGGAILARYPSEWLLDVLEAGGSFFG